MVLFCSLAEHPQNWYPLHSVHIPLYSQHFCPDLDRNCMFYTQYTAIARLSLELSTLERISNRTDDLQKKEKIIPVKPLHCCQWSQIVHRKITLSITYSNTEFWLSRYSSIFRCIYSYLHKNNTLDSKWQAHIQKTTKIAFHNWIEKHDKTGHHYHIFKETSRSQMNYLCYVNCLPSGSTRFSWANYIICYRCILLICMGQE